MPAFHSQLNKEEKFNAFNRQNSKRQSAYNSATANLKGYGYKMVWSNYLEELAQISIKHWDKATHAENLGDTLAAIYKCRRKVTLDRSNIRLTENTAFAPQTIIESVNGWFNEKKYFDDEWTLQNGHFLNMWAPRVQEVGCAKNEKGFTCLYSGGWGYNAEFIPFTSCPAGYAPDPKYSKLCVCTLATKPTMKNGYKCTN